MLTTEAFDINGVKCFQTVVPRTLDVATYTVSWITIFICTCGSILSACFGEPAILASGALASIVFIAQIVLYLIVLTYIDSNKVMLSRKKLFM